MKVFCGNCQKTVGQVPDDKIPLNKIVLAKCPLCGKQIKLQKTELKAEVTNLQTHSIPSPKESPPPVSANRTIDGKSQPPNPQHHSGFKDTPSHRDVPENPHKLWKQLIGLGIASLILAMFNFLGVITGIFTFIDAWKAGIYKKKDSKSFINISPMGWGIVMQGIFIVAFPLYLANRNKLKAKEGQNVWYILTIIFGGLTLSLAALKIAKLMTVT